jgi:hypothetical protein
VVVEIPRFFAEFEAKEAIIAESKPHIPSVICLSLKEF